VSDLEQLRRDLAGLAAPAPINAAATPQASKPHPLRWWQFHQAVIGFLYYLMLYPMWRVKAMTPGSWGYLMSQREDLSLKCKACSAGAKEDIEE
jgi:hypothetical protein